MPMTNKVMVWFEPLLNAVDAKGRHGNELFNKHGEGAFRDWVRGIAKGIGVPKEVREQVSTEVVDEILQF